MRIALTGVAALCSIAAATGPVRSILIPATTYEYLVRVQGIDGADKAERVIRMRGTISGDKVRMDVLHGGDSAAVGMGRAGTYMLLLDRGQRLVTVDTAKKEYSEFELAKMAGQIDQMMKQFSGLGAELSVYDVKANAEDLGAGETILGYPTRHWRTSNEMSFAFKMDLDDIVMGIETTTDLYYAAGLERLVLPSTLQDSLQANPFASLMKPEDAKRFRDAQARLPKATPIKSVARTSMDFNGVKTGTVTTTEIVSISDTDVVPSIFEVPAGFKLMKMPEMKMPALPPAG